MLARVLALPDSDAARIIAEQQRDETLIIPGGVLAVIAPVLAQHYTHTNLDFLFTGAGAPGDPPEGSKALKTAEWLRRVNREKPDEAHLILGRLLEEFMDEVLDERPAWGWDGYQPAAERLAARDRIAKALAVAGMQYLPGGQVAVPNASIATRQLKTIIREGDLVAVTAEFERATEISGSRPREALSHAANTLEAVPGEMIELMDLTAPKERTLRTLWHTVRVHLSIDAKEMDDQDLRKIAGAMGALIEGLADLRNDKSIAHALKPEVARNHRIEPRHARLAINAAHTLAVFLLETLAAKSRLRRKTV